MKKFQVVELHNKMHVLGSLKGEKLVYAVVKNAQILAHCVKRIQSEIQSLQIQHTKKDKDGKVAIGKDGQAEFDNGYNFQREFEKLMEGDVDIVFHKIKKEFVPKDITVEQMGAMIEFIEE